ncbi:MAG: hypothetical protein IJI37_07505 [Opitutales bacterium]|nr:hypothetical protein [Opitutales bacterium]
MFAEKTMIIDASGRRVKAALAENGKLAGAAQAREAALESLSDAACSLCEDFSKVRAYAVCTGPGSMLGERCASAFASTLARLFGAEIFEWDCMKAAAFFISDKDGAPESFAIAAPSRKGFANVLEMRGGKILREEEVEISALENIPEKTKKYLLAQRDIIPAGFENFEKIEMSAEDIFGTLNRHARLLSKCGEPPDAKALSKREFVKWKAQAHT